MTETLIYESSREHLMKNIAELQKLQEDGINVGALEEEIWENMVELIRMEDSEKLGKLREELKGMGPNPINGC